jgi:uncharacterized protein YutE (UPF0331/DUF86 family)
MTSIAVLENKISAVRKNLAILKGFSPHSREEIENNVQLRGAVERYLYLAIQGTIDLAEAILAYKKLRKPSTLSEIFYILNEEKIITSEITQYMVAMTGFRNILAHDYEKINYAIVYDVLQNRLPDIETFLKIAAKQI